MTENSNKLEAFVSYSHKDIPYMEEFLINMNVIRQTHNVSVFYDGKINLGEDIDDEVCVNLEKSDIIFLLVSQNFLSSYYCMKIELEKAIERHRAGQCIVIPIIIKRCHIDKDLLFKGLKRTPKDGKPISTFKSRNDGFVNATEQIIALIDEKFEKTRFSKSKATNSVVKAELQKQDIEEGARKVGSEIEIENSNIDKSSSMITEFPQTYSYDIYQDGELLPYKLDISTWNAVTYICEKSAIFNEIVIDNIKNATKFYTDERKEAKKNGFEIGIQFRVKILQGFLNDLCGLIVKWFFQDFGVRVHVSKLTKNKKTYEGYCVVDGSPKTSETNARPAKIISRISSHDSLFSLSGEKHAPIIRSLNTKHNAKSENEDKHPEYYVYAFSLKGWDMQKSLLCLGISIEKDYVVHHSPILAALVITNFHKLLEYYINSYLKKVGEIDKEFDINNLL